VILVALILNLQCYLPTNSPTAYHRKKLSTLFQNTLNQTEDMSKQIRDLLIDRLEDLIGLVEAHEFESPQIDSSIVETKRIINQIQKGDKDAGFEDNL
jgi:hypothetical protein